MGTTFDFIVAFFGSVSFSKDFKTTLESCSEAEINNFYNFSQNGPCQNYSNKVKCIVEEMESLVLLILLTDIYN